MVYARDLDLSKAACMSLFKLAKYYKWILLVVRSEELIQYSACLLLL